VKPAFVQDAFEVRHVFLLRVVDEDEVDTTGGKPVFLAEAPQGGSAIPERPHHSRDPVGDPGVLPDAAGDRGVGGVELD